MSLWEDCKPWVPPPMKVKRPACFRAALPKPKSEPKSEPKPEPVEPVESRYRARGSNGAPVTSRPSEATGLYRGVPIKGRPSRRTRVSGHNLVAKPCAASVDQIDFALSRTDMTYLQIVEHLGAPVTRAMVRHWRSGNLPRAYLRAKGLVDA